MYKGHSLIGLKVISHDNGEELGSVKDLIFDHDSNQALALLLSDKDLFGLIDAQIVPWEQIETVGDDAVVVSSANAKIKAGNYPQVKRIMDRDTALAGTKMYTTQGKYLGTLGDVSIDPKTGHIEGYEVSDGMVKDTISGKRYVSSNEQIQLGRDVAFVPPVVGADLEAQKQEPGGLHAKFVDASDKAKSAYREVASASVEKQKEYVIGKTASREVAVEADAAAQPPVAGQVIVREGEIISAEQADRAANAGVLHNLVASAAGTAADDAKDSAGTWTADMQHRAEEAAIGQPASRSVEADDGQLIVAKGETITRGVLDHATLHDKKNAVVAAAGLGAASQTASDVGGTISKGASNLWDSVKEKASEFTHAAGEKKKELDAEAQQARINRALGRPVTRVILDQSDNVILNTGDLITHKAIDSARAADALDILLDSVFTENPDITPEMMRLEEPGAAALDSQAEPSGGPITATVSPDAPSQDTPAQDQRAM